MREKRRLAGGGGQRRAAAGSQAPHCPGPSDEVGARPREPPHDCASLGAVGTAPVPLKPWDYRQRAERRRPGHGMAPLAAQSPPEGLVTCSWRRPQSSGQNVLPDGEQVSLHTPWEHPLPPHKAPAPVT